PFDGEMRPIVLEAGQFGRETISDVKRVAPAGDPPIRQRLVAGIAKFLHAGAKLFRKIDNPRANLFGATDSDEILCVSCICEPAMDPLSRRNTPGVAVFIATFDAEKNFHPD